jgi:hypothetical protein
VKFLIAIFATIVLLVHTQPISLLAGVAAERTLSSADFRLQIQLMVAPAAGLLVWLVATMLAVYKPRGMTRYGWRKQHEQRTVSPAVDAEPKASAISLPPQASFAPEEGSI